MKIKDKIILITGGAIRIGRAITLELIKCGANVFCHYNSSNAEAQSLQKEVSRLEGNLYLIQADLSKLNNSVDLIDKVFRKKGRIDILINNAAIFFKTPLGTVTEEDWDKLFSINLKVPFFMAQKVGLIMKKQGFGKIINIGDTSGLNLWPGYLPYSLTKGGIISMTKGLAKALAPEVLVNCVNPGPVMVPDYYNEKDIKKAIDKTLLKKAGSANDIVQTIKYLIEGTDYITGSIINVDGGRNLN
ncbi:MAG: SDR family oxidoreductase [Calditrichia bacterium]|nr:SDR family oxidoreductase [Calditrichia bacterium]